MFWKLLRRYFFSFPVEKVSKPTKEGIEINEEGGTKKYAHSVRMLAFERSGDSPHHALMEFPAEFIPFSLSVIPSICILARMLR